MCVLKACVQGDILGLFWGKLGEKRPGRKIFTKGKYLFLCHTFLFVLHKCLFVRHKCLFVHHTCLFVHHTDIDQFIIYQGYKGNILCVLKACVQADILRLLWGKLGEKRPGRKIFTIGKMFVCPSHWYRPIHYLPRL